MTQYRKKPVVIEAEQFWPGTDYPPKGVLHSGLDPDDGKPAYYIETLEGMMRIKPGDWIITNVQGERYPCQDDIFKLMYDLVEEPDDG